MKRFIIFGCVVIITGVILLMVGITLLSVLSKETTILELTITDYTSDTPENSSNSSIITVREGNRFGPKNLSAQISDRPFKLLRITDQNTINVSIMEELMYYGQNAIDSTRLITTENTCFADLSSDNNTEICIRVI
jgi:hypothetical protein